MLMDAAMHAERALPGVMLTDLRARRGIPRIISAEDSYRPWHGQVLAALQRPSARGGDCELAEVHAELTRDPDLPRSVSHDAVPLADLLHAAPEPSHAPAYAGIVIGAAIRRELAVGGGRMRQASEASGEPVDDLALEAVRSVVTRAGRGIGACRQRWGKLPDPVRRELPAAPRDGQVNAEIAWRAGRVRDESARLRQDLRAGDHASLADRLAAIASPLAGENAKSASRAAGGSGPWPAACRSGHGELGGSPARHLGRSR